MLPTRTLGRTGYEITRAGLGAWAIGGSDGIGWGQQADDDSIATIRHAVELGINWIDTAAVYGKGHSEEVIAKALAGFGEGDRPLVFTKGGLPFVDGQPQDIANPASLRTELEESLRRLDVEAIDLYQVHWPSQDGTPMEETWAAMLGFVEEGKARAVGVSNYSVTQLELSAGAGPLASLQPQLSLLHRAPAEDVIPWAHAHGAGVIVYSPMGSGLLTGSFTAERASSLSKDDWRASNPRFRGEPLARSIELVEALRPIAERREVSIGCVAAAWALAWPVVTGAIIGARRAAQVDGWIAAAELELSAAELDAIAAALERTHAGDGGPVHPTRKLDPDDLENA